MALNYLFKSKFIIFWHVFFIFYNIEIWANLANSTRNDPFPLFSTIYPYSYLTRKQKENLAFFDYDYPATNFRVSASGYRQYTTFARNQDGDVINLGDSPNGRWNMLGLFYDPILRDKLFTLLNITSAILAPENCNIADNNSLCFCLVTDPILSDPKKEFGFFSIPALYRKYGVRFENEFFLIDRCFYSVGIKFQFGIADIKQMPFDFEDFTCQALGIACPANSSVIVGPGSGSCPVPNPAIPPVVNPEFTATTDSTASSVPPCITNTGPVSTTSCVFLPQTFQPCCDSSLCLSFTAECKRIVIEQIMRQRRLITRYLGINTLRYDHIGVEDARIYLFWRHVFVINEEDERYPRLVFTPFAEAGAAMPLDVQVDTDKFFGLPVGNNSHVSTGATFGCTLDFLDSIELIFQVGFTKFFEREYCGYRLPTSTKESGIFPYKADIKRTPGTTWFTGFGLNVDKFIDNLSVWLEYLIIKHREDDIDVCKSYIPTTSIYYNQGFLTKYYQEQTGWGAQVVNASFNYDIAEDMSVGVLWQLAARQRNAFQSSTFLATLSFVY